MNHREEARKMFVEEHLLWSEAVVGGFGVELGLTGEL